MDQNKRCFPPVVSPATRVLVLGSLPGDASLKAAQYYAHPRNHFWPIMGRLLDSSLVDLGYEARLSVLKTAGVGLWDVVAEASRKGSLDADLREVSGNDLSRLIDSLPGLRVVAFNGQTAARIGLRQLGEAAARLTVLTLPSTSPAHTLPLEEKWRQWSVLADWLA
ncbi:DNA-deoxyinosine glycosylase [uncultured Aquitalea sp.]|uniref:DNA-deoxyinosine glycosylase n=1 Tax=uncultured Aquitalea sp. TaxID=540272 RepID=UPI0025F96C50|nr:DNA-deoxyinosine glycosylase [uncultured Aquitalea sp.]